MLQQLGRVHSFIDEKRIEAENNVNIIDSDRQLG
jgi:hypothetical protein